MNSHIKEEQFGQVFLFHKFQINFAFDKTQLDKTSNIFLAVGIMSVHLRKFSEKTF
jgi:hypothetical protein